MSGFKAMENLFTNLNINLQNTDPEAILNLLQPGLCHYLILGLIIFIIGIIIIISSGNLIKTLIGLQFMLTSVCINFVAANTFLTNENGQRGLLDGILNNPAAQSAIAESFSAQKSLNFTFLNPEGQAIGLIVTVFTVINAAAFLGLICAIFFKCKNIEISPLSTLKSADCPTDQDLENESGL